MENEVDRATRHPYLWMSCNSVGVFEGEGRRKEVRQKGGTRNNFKPSQRTGIVWETSAGLSPHALALFRPCESQTPLASLIGLDASTAIVITMAEISPCSCSTTTPYTDPPFT